jgi:hypothetical protein
MSIPAQLLHSLAGKFFNDALAARRELYKNNPVIRAAVRAAQQSHSDKPVNALDGRVVPDEKTRRKALNGDAAPPRHSAYGEQKLKLLGFQPGRPRGFVAIRDEQADLVAELRQ